MPAIGLAHHLQCRPLLEIEDTRRRVAALRLQVDQRIGQGQVRFPADVIRGSGRMFLGEFGPALALAVK